MNMIVSFHWPINNNFWRYLEITFRRYLAIIFKISVRFIHTKRTKIWVFKFFRYYFRLWRGRYFIFAKRGCNWNEKIVYRNFFHKQEEKRPFNNLTRNKTSREGVFFSYGLIHLINVFQNSNILDICRDICWKVRKTQPI